MMRMVTLLVNKLVKRRDVREKAVQVLFQMIDAPDYLTAEIATSFALEAGNDPEAGFDEVSDPYLYQIIEGVQAHQEVIDEKIIEYLSDWTIERIAKIDLVILRVAFYELLFVDNELVPPKVAVNEAIDLSKVFSDEKSRRFVSGVLLEYLNKTR